GDAICNNISDAVAALAEDGVQVIPHYLGITTVPSVGFSCISNHVAAQLGFDVPGDASACSFPAGIAPAESWGPATAIVAQNFNWREGAARMIVPVSDEAPCHGTIPGGCNDPGDDRSSAENAISVSIANNVIVSPIIGSNADACAMALASHVADATGGQSYESDLAPMDIPNILPSLFVDGCVASLGDPCDDGTACTDDACTEEGVCENTPNYDSATACCDPSSGTQTVIDDGNDCTDDVCNEQTGNVTHEFSAEDALCDDGDACTVADKCDGEGTCAGTFRNCDDGIECTLDECQPGTGACLHTPQDEVCDNNIYCDGVEVCDVDNGCVPDATFSCDDGNACTDDSCDEDGDTCIHVNNFDPATECCNPATGEKTVIDDGNDCTVDVCDTDTGVVEHVSLSSPCDDGNLCTTNDVCQGGQCVGQPVLCFDGIGCTIDTCNPQTGQCTYTPDDSICDDGFHCNGAEVCGLLTDCVAGTAPNCDDGIACTQDRCDEDANACVHETDDSACDNGIFCDGAETCDADLGCQAGSVPTCDDQIACTVDTCSPNTDACLHVPVSELCKDGIFCNGVEVCDPAVGCVDGPDPECADNLPCTLDVCHEEDRECKHLPIDAECDNGIFCDGDEICDPLFGCLSSSTRDCDDQNACTIDFCDDLADECDYSLIYDPETECCDPVTGNIISLVNSETCMLGECNPETGEVSFRPAPVGTPCSDAAQCTGPDVCDGLGNCSGDPINDRPCQSDDDCEGLLCDLSSNTCICSRELCVDLISPTSCQEVGVPFTIDIRMGFGPQTVVGGQFVIPYNPSVLQLESIVPGQQVDPNSPFALEIFRDIDAEQGLIVYSVGIVPGNLGSQGPELLASLTFLPLQACEEETICYISENPLNTLLTNDEGNKVPFDLCCPGPISINDGAPVLTCPDSMSVNPAPGGLNANLSWSPAAAVDGCDEPVVTCQAEHSLGFDIDYLIQAGGATPFGTSTFTCQATDSCGQTDTCSWTVDVSGQNEVRASVQISPSMSAGPLQRCVEFEFYSSCVELPHVERMPLNFGLPFELPGVSMNQTFEIPAGQYFCVTARDPLHTLRSATEVVKVGNEFVLDFVGDPNVGGNWLRAGNLDESNVIDVYDFMVFWDEEFKAMEPDNSCGTVAPHADINGDGIVDSLDFDMISNHYLQEDHFSCCDNTGSVASFPAVQPVTRVSIQTLVEQGLSHLVVGDLTGDGWIDQDDIDAYRRGVRPQNGNAGNSD
ncbi:MAG: cohesin domain-containing protein, partial [Phycisphaerae bacterium]